MSRRHRYTPPGFDRKRHFRRRLQWTRINLLGWIGLAVLYYAGFSFFFDTPVEHAMKEETRLLREQYTALTSRYDSLERVLDNVVERDRNVFGILFESQPYDLGSDYGNTRWKSYERLLAYTNRELGDAFFAKTELLEKQLKALRASDDTLRSRIAQAGDKTARIPAIQPVNNPDLTLLTASYGMRIHPFFKSLSAHQGVDYTVPEGTRVFATADGIVREVSTRHTTSGLSVVISHENGYETSYSNLSRANVRKGQRVRRGDIIALSGNSGLSLAPHLHYEVRHQGMRVDPIHYFFLELSPAEYRKIIRIAGSGMQSFD